VVASAKDPTMPNVTVTILNRSTVLQDAELANAAMALQKQVTQHFAPAWGIDAKITFTPRGQRPAPGEWWLVVLDVTDLAGALGYHDSTNEGLPMG
jgi:hypothetical protein